MKRDLFNYINCTYIWPCSDCLYLSIVYLLHQFISHCVLALVLIHHSNKTLIMSRCQKIAAPTLNVVHGQSPTLFWQTASYIETLCSKLEILYRVYEGRQTGGKEYRQKGRQKSAQTDRWICRQNRHIGRPITLLNPYPNFLIPSNDLPDAGHRMRTPRCVCFFPCSENYMNEVNT